MWLQSLAAELPITLADGTVWLSIGQGLLVSAICLLFGSWVARFVGLLSAEAPAGETLAVGLASGMLALTAGWAAVASGGRSSFTPVAIGFALSIALAARRRWRRVEDADSLVEGATTGDTVRPALGTARRRDLVVAVVGGGIFIVAVALLYGSTLMQSPRDGVQPLEFTDGAFYSVLGSDLANTGTETIYAPSGFDVVDGLPSQTWYHWGELWLAGAAIAILGTAPLDARHFIVLPLLVLTGAALSGTLVRRVTGSPSQGAYLFGFFAFLFLAPVPVLQAGHFSSWAIGMLFAITMFGLAAIAVLLAIYGLITLGGRAVSWALAVFAGSAAAMILPAHIVIAVLALVGIGSVWAIHIGRSLIATQRLPQVALIWRRTIVVTAIGLFTTLVWSFLTGHGAVSSSPTPGVSPFNEAWRGALATVVVGAGVFLAIPIAWLIDRRNESIEADLYAGTAVLLVGGAFVWGARLADFNTFYLFYGGLAIFGTLAAAVAVWAIWLRLRATTNRRLALVLVVIAVVQIEVGIGLSTNRLQEFGPGGLTPVPTEILAAIRALPSEAKLAYGCLPTEEQAFWLPRLLSLRGHTGRAVVPMCFESEFFAKLLGGPTSADVRSPQFDWAPQRVLYPSPQARPSPIEVATFLSANGIGYIYADTEHPNTLIPDAIPIATSGGTQVLRLP